MWKEKNIKELFADFKGEYEPIEVKYIDELIYNFIQENNLDFEKILKYARQTNSKTVIEKIVMIAR